MYNRYIPKNGSYQRTSEPDDLPPQSESRQPRRAPVRPKPPPPPPVPQKPQGKGLLGNLLKGLNIGDLDTGDILLLLILLLLFIDGEDDEIIIVLAIVLFLGFN